MGRIGVWLLCCAVTTAAVLFVHDTVDGRALVSIYMLMGAPMALHWLFN